jgi:alpha-methylacyl-CoA racemase
MGPLDGLRIVEIAAIGPVPFAGMMLADLGADVVRVDRVDGSRPAGPHRVLDRGRRSVAVDLKDRRVVDVVLRMAERCDVLIEGFRPGVAERLGIGPEPCREHNPGLIYARMTGWGQDGPLAGTPGHDINYHALSGALDVIGPAGGPPVPPVNLLGDFAGGGLPLVAGILAALYERQRSGVGQVVDAAIVDGVAGLLSMVLGMTAAGQWQPERGTNVLDGGAPFYAVYPCADGRYLAVGAIEEPFYLALLDGLGLDPALLPERLSPVSWPELRQTFAARFAARDRDGWLAVFAGTDACVTPVLTVAEAAGHPHQLARGTYVTGDGLVQPAPAPRFSRTPAWLPAPAPALGQHTREVLAEYGLSRPAIEALLSDGVAAVAVNGLDD